MAKKDKKVDTIEKEVLVTPELENIETVGEETVIANEDTVEESECEDTVEEDEGDAEYYDVEEDEGEDDVEEVVETPEEVVEKKEVKNFTHKTKYWSGVSDGWY